MRNTTLIQTGMSSVGELPRRSTVGDQRVKPSDPAILVMNDFTREYPVTVDVERQIDAALADMIRLGVRGLLVVRAHKVVGFITSYDLEGERPIQYMQHSNYNRRQDLQVGQIMTAWTDLITLSWAAVKDASVSSILDVFHDTGLMHLLVVERSTDGTCTIRGLFSRTRLERQLEVLAAKRA